MRKKDSKVLRPASTKVSLSESLVNEEIKTEGELLLKLTPLPPADIYSFMDGLKPGTYFSMGLLTMLKLNDEGKKSIRVYRILEYSAIVSGVEYENIATTKEFRARTGKLPGGTWWNHEPGYETKIAYRKKDPRDKYVIWDIQRSKSATSRLYLVDLINNSFKAVSEADLLRDMDKYLVEDDRKKLRHETHTQQAADKQTGEIVELKTKYRTGKFENVFWLKQNGKATGEKGKKFEEDFDGDDIVEFTDLHANCERVDVDGILSGRLNMDGTPAEDYVEDSEDYGEVEEYNEGVRVNARKSKRIKEGLAPRRRRVATREITKNTKKPIIMNSLDEFFTDF